MNNPNKSQTPEEREAELKANEAAEKARRDRQERQEAQRRSDAAAAQRSHLGE